MGTRRNTKRLSAAINEYLDLQLREISATSSRATYNQDATVLGMYLRIVGDRQCGSMTADHVWAFFYGDGGVCDTHITLSKRSKTLTMPPVGDQTHNSYRSRLRQFVAWGIAKGYFAPGLMHDAFDRRWGRVKPRKVPRVSRQQPPPMSMLAMLDTANNPRDRCYLATAMNSALRQCEITAIRVRQVSLDAGFLLGVVIGKTGDVDDVPISAELDKELRVWLEAYEHDLGRPLDPDDHLFPTRTGGAFQRWEYLENGDREPVRAGFTWIPEKPVRGTNGIVQRALKALGLDTHKEGTHTLRRAVALAYFREAAREDPGTAMRQTMDLLHHKSQATTERYLQMTSERHQRNERMRGKPFLSAMVDQDNVVPLRPKAGGQ